MSSHSASGRQDVETYARFLDTGKHSDFIIECGGHEMKVHKILLCAKSDFFDRLCASPFQESSTSRVKLDGEHPAILARVLLFIYTDTYPVSDISASDTGHGQFKSIQDPFKNDSADEEEWVKRSKLHVLVYAVAEKYAISGLQKHSAHRFLIAFAEEEDIAIHPENGNPWTPPTPERNHEDSSGEEDSPDIDTDLPHRKVLPRDPSIDAGDSWTNEAETIRLVYSSTPLHSPTLRHAVVWQIKRCIANQKTPHPLESDALLAVIHDVADFAFDLASTVLSQIKYRCSKCASKSRSLVRRCQCRKLDRCLEPACLQRMQEESICAECFCFGTVMFPERANQHADVEDDS